MTITEKSMSGKTCLITGATAGIGEATARELARRGAPVIIVGRNRERCEFTAESIRRATGNPRVEFIAADLSSQREIRRLAREFHERHDRLDVLVNNAGALFALRRESVDGIEMTMALNHLACFLLTNLLLDTLKASAPSRIVNVSSSAHDDVKGFDFEDPQVRTGASGRKYGDSEFMSLMYTLAIPMKHPGFMQYAQTKLANLLFTHELARRLEGSGVTVNALHPGLVASNFTSGNGAFGLFMRAWTRLLGVSAEEGAKTPIHLACSPTMEGISGQYFVKEKSVPSSPASLNASAAQRLWELSEALTANSGSGRSI
ncbi:MAG: SDR family oxidoreductase [Planctomycetes bacterium]|nr:SDR family oxidoreductase [Planctomycetota bacterium]